MGDETVEHGTVRLVIVHAVVQERTQEAATLGHTESVGVLQLAGSCGAGRAFEPEVRGDVSGGQQAEADYRCASGGIDDLVDLAGLEASLQVDVAGIGDAAAVLHPGKPPLLSRYDMLAGVLVVLHSHHRFPVFQPVGRVGTVHPVGEVLGLDLGIGLEGYDNPAGYGLAVFHRLRRMDAQQAGSVGDVVLPAAPDDGIALPHQEAVAGVQRRVWCDVGSAVDVAQGQGLASIQHVEQQAAITFGRVVRPQNAEIGREFHQPLLVARERA